IAKIPEGKKYRSGQKIKCSVEIIDDSGITVKIPYWKQNGFIPNEELSSSLDPATAKTKLKRGDVIECSILSTEGGLKLSRKVIEILYKDDELVDGIKLGNEFEIVMQKAVKGGLLGNLGSYKVFVPASQIRNGFVKTLEQYEGKKLKLVALPDSVDEVKHKIVASARAVIMKEKQEKEDNFWNNIEVDEIVEGKVLRFAPFGAFVSVRGFDCLAHLSDLSWTPVKEPSEVLELNKTYEFVVLKLDREANRVSIGYKQLQPQPWQQASDKFPIGAVVKGKVARILPFGAFVELDKGIDGLLHISNVSWEWLGDINQVLKVGDEIEVQVIGFDIDAKRITLSRKSLLEKPAELPEHNNEHESQE
ncbi:MAG: S1 RNA-binding domain-containing protein, partial [Clostridia bacterium]